MNNKVKLIRKNNKFFIKTKNKLFSINILPVDNNFLIYNPKENIDYYVLVLVPDGEHAKIGILNKKEIEENPIKRSNLKIIDYENDN
ncbi:MAG: hypothetical protein ACP5IV_07700, partial [Caldisericia bacterium]